MTLRCLRLPHWLPLAGVALTGVLTLAACAEPEDADPDSDTDSGSEADSGSDASDATADSGSENNDCDSNEFFTIGAETFTEGVSAIEAGECDPLVESMDLVPNPVAGLEAHSAFGFGLSRGHEGGNDYERAVNIVITDPDGQTLTPGDLLVGADEGVAIVLSDSMGDLTCVAETGTVTLDALPPEGGYIEGSFEVEAWAEPTVGDCPAVPWAGTFNALHDEHF